MLDMEILQKINQLENQILADWKKNFHDLPSRQQVMNIMTVGYNLNLEEVQEYYGVKPLPFKTVSEVLPSGAELAAITIAKLNQPLTEIDDIEDFYDKLDKINLDVSSLDDPTVADYSNVRAAFQSLSDCKRCGYGKAPVYDYCRKTVARVVDGHITVSSCECSAPRVLALAKRAGIPASYAYKTSNDFTVTDANSDAVDAAINSITGNSGLYLYGAVRTGKTLLCSIIANAKLKKKKPVFMQTVTDMLDGLRDFDNNLERVNKLNNLKSHPCIIIDDLGAEYQSDWVASTLFSILDARYKNNLQTIINSNFCLDELANHIKGYHGKRISRRIADMCKVISIG